MTIRGHRMSNPWSELSRKAHSYSMFGRVAESRIRAHSGTSLTRRSSPRHKPDVSCLRTRLEATASPVHCQEPGNLRIIERKWREYTIEIVHESAHRERRLVKGKGCTVNMPPYSLLYASRLADNLAPKPLAPPAATVGLQWFPALVLEVLCEFVRNGVYPTIIRWIRPRLRDVSRLKGVLAAQYLRLL